MTTVVINLVHLDPPRNGGVSRIAHEVTRLLYDMPGINAVCVVGAGFAQQFPAWLGRDAQVIPYLANQPPTPLIKALKPDFIISPLFGIEPFEGDDFKDAVHVTGLVDALALDKQELFLPHEQQVRVLSYKRARAAKVIVTLSEHAKQRLMAQLQLPAQQIRVVGLGADMEAQQVKDGQAMLPDVPQPFVFYPANNWPHKRHDLLFKVMSEVWKTRPELHLVLTGGRSGGVDLAALIAGTPEGRVHDLGYVDEAHVRWLYQHAETMLFLSEHEGFGMPVVEAMLNGCPVICAPLTSIPEVAGEAALYVHSADAQAWANALLNELPTKRMALIEAGKKQAAQYTWAKARDGWAAALQAAGLQPGKTSEAVMVPLAAVIAEIERWREDGGGVSSSGTRQSSAKLERLLQQTEAIRLAENQSGLAKVPVIGFFIRSLIRVRNLGHMWEARAHLDRAIIDQLAALDADGKAEKR